jgi:outer membrane receptor for ferrienterochelin and colicin
MKFKLLLIAICTALFAVSLLAQEQESAKQLSEMSLEDLLNLEVTTASKKAEKNTDAPGIISTITKEEIK